MDITQITVAVITLLGIIITTVAAPYIKSKTNANQQKDLALLVQIAVASAEQIFKNTAMGKEKRQHVLDFLKSQGIEIDDSVVFEKINNLIEAFVAELNGKAMVSI